MASPSKATDPPLSSFVFTFAFPYRPAFKPTKKPTMFADLPTEIIDRIGACMRDIDRLKMRVLLPKHRQHIIIDELEEFLQRLYVMPTRSSIDNFKYICQSPFYQDRIEEVIFVSFVPNAQKPMIASLSEFERTFKRELLDPGYCYPIDDNQLEESYLRYRQLYARRITGPKAHDTQQPIFAPSDELVGEAELEAVLFAALPRLPRLRKVGIHTTVSAPGLNSSPTWRGDATFSYDWSEWEFISVTEPISRMLFIGTHGTSTTVLPFLGAIDAVRTPKVHLDIVFEMVHAGIDRGQDHWVDWQSSRAIARKVDHLTVQCADFALGLEPQVCLAKTIIRAASGAEHLDIVLRTMTAHITCAKIQVADTWNSILLQFLIAAAFGPYRNINIVGGEGAPSAIHPKYIQDLIRRSESLERLTLCQMVPFHRAGSGTFPDRMRGLLKDVCQRRYLQHFSMKLTDWKDWWCDSLVSECDCSETTAYHDTNDAESLARDLGLVADDSGRYDFGQYVMAGCMEDD